MRSAVSAQRGPAELRAVIFDMDGVLADTEPVWRAVEIEIFSGLGVHLTEAECRQTMGMRVEEVVEMWHRRRPWRGESVAGVTGRIVDAVVASVRAGGVAIDGAVGAVAAARRAGLMCAVASSSPPSLITAVIESLGIEGDVDVACSAVDDTNGKPAPDIYLRTATELGVSPASCLAVEDSVNGVLSARAAGMVCIAVPDQVTASDPRIGAATVTLRSLRELDDGRLDELRRTYFA